MIKNTYPTEILDVRITKFDEKGWGQARYTHPPVVEGGLGKKLTIHIPNTVPGDLVRVTVPNAKGRRRANLDYDALLEASPDRNPAIQEQAHGSAGAPLQFMHYTSQLIYKENYVREQLEQNGFDSGLVKPIIGMAEPTRYRNKMELSFGRDGELGMHQAGNYKKVVDLEDSILAPLEMIEVKHIVSQWQKDFDLSGYNPEEASGLLRNLVIRRSFATKELMVVVVVTEGPEAYTEAIESLKTRLIDRLPDLTSFIWSENTGNTRAKEEDTDHLIYGREYIYDELMGFRFRIWQNTFFQPNPVQAEVMVNEALALAGDISNQRVLDLYCGIGTFSLPFAKRSQALAGIEIVEASILSARRNASENNIGNTYFVSGDARKGMQDLKEIWGDPDLLIVDPPRSGTGGKMMRAIGRLGVEKFIYVSCNPKTFAEDIVWLRDYGYDLVSVQPVDQFPHTTHIELITMLKKVREAVAR